MTTPRSFPGRAALAGASAGAFAVLLSLGLQVMRGGKPWFDEPVRQWVHAHASPAATWFMVGVSRIGEPLVLSIAAALMIIRWLLAGRWRTALPFAVAVGGANLIEFIVRNVVERPRPQPFYGHRPSSFSFPSGHALMSCAFFGSLALVAAARTGKRSQRWLYYAIAMAATGAIGLSRIYLGVHYPSDVLGGFAEGLFWICIVILAFRRNEPAGPHVTAVK